MKTSSIPVSNIFAASNFQEFIMNFVRETADVVLMELDMITRDDWSTFRELMHIYDPILLFTSAEATFEKARLAIDMQALDLMIKPFSTNKIKIAFQKAYRRFETKKLSNGIFNVNTYPIADSNNPENDKDAEIIVVGVPLSRSSISVSGASEFPEAFRRSKKE